jgi:hypothetical protein
VPNLRHDPETLQEAAAWVCAVVARYGPCLPLGTRQCPRWLPAEACCCSHSSRLSTLRPYPIGKSRFKKTVQVFTTGNATTEKCPCFRLQLYASTPLRSPSSGPTSSYRRQSRTDCWELDIRRRTRASNPRHN